MPNALTQDVQDIVLSLMEGLSCPRSLTVAILVRYAEWDQVTQLGAIPSHYSNAFAYLDAVAATDLLRKYRDFDLPIDVEALTYDKWVWAELECYKSNERLSPLLYGGSHGSVYGVAMGDFIVSFRKNVERLIGNGPTTCEGRFGPGATMSDSSRFTLVPDKMSSVPTLTPDAWNHLSSWTTTKWASASRILGNDPLCIRGNAYFSVPKTARVKRACAKEPSLNGYYQLGLGRELKYRLKLAGFDLKKGQDVHRQVACAASISGLLATIDLSSASDTVCTNLVKLVLPSRWHEALDSLRSPFTRVNGSWRKLEKFSSMGNGYTFELETVIFAAICMTCLGTNAFPGKNLFVYGDDIIVPTEHAVDVIAALKFFGFTPNEKKTFTEGPFRESCGGDFFEGVSVRPYQLEEDPNEPQKIISLANGIRRMAHQNHFDSIRWPLLRRAWFKCLDLLPHSIKHCRGPEELGDLVIWDDEANWSCRQRGSIRYLNVYRPADYKIVAWEGYAYEVQMAAALYGVVLTNRKNKSFSYRATNDPRGLIGRDSVLGYKVGWIPYTGYGIKDYFPPSSILRKKLPRWGQ